MQNLTFGRVRSPARRWQVITLTQGLSSDLCREIVFLKDLKLKEGTVPPSEGDTVRISSASKDDLQAPWRHCAATTSGVELEVRQLARTADAMQPLGGRATASR